MTDNRVYWIWLQRGLAAGSPRVSKILSRFGSPKEFFEGGREYWLTPGLLSEREYEALDSFTLEDAAALVRERGGWASVEIREDLTHRPRVLVARRATDGEE